MLGLDSTSLARRAKTTAVSNANAKAPKATHTCCSTSGSHNNGCYKRLAYFTTTIPASQRSEIVELCRNNGTVILADEGGLFPRDW